METSGRIWPNFEVIQAFMNVLIAGKYEKDQMKNSGENYKSMGFFQTLKGRQLGSRRISNSFKLCKYEMNPIKNVRENVMTPFFPVGLYLLPWKPVFVSGRISNSSKLLVMSSLPANMKSIRLKIAEKM